MPEDHTSHPEQPADSAATAAAAQSRFLSLGAGLLLVALVAVVTGVVLLPYYTPVAGEAHPSVAAIQASPLLRVVRAVHHWASALLILLGAAYLVYGLFTCSYRRPWHLAWVAALGIVLTFFAFQLTGHLLPWDVHAVRSTVIEAGIAENVPVVGSMQGRLVRGGTETVSPQTLQAWYAAHVGLLPLALAALAALFVIPMRRMGFRLTPPRAAVGVTLALLLVAALLLPVPLGPEATPEDYTSFASPPEWYVLPLHGLLNIAQRVRPSLSFIGTVVLPGLAVLWLLALPWLDRRRLGGPPSPLVRGLTAIGAAGLVLLTLINADRMAPLFTHPEPQRAAVQSAAAVDTPLDPALVAQGKELYDQNGCAGCHKLAGQGNAVGPPLDKVGQLHPDLDWQIRHLKDPASVVQGSTMPAYSQLSEADLQALATYMLSLR